MKTIEQAKIELLDSIIDNGHIDDNSLIRLCDNNNIDDLLILEIMFVSQDYLKTIRQENNGE